MFSRRSRSTGSASLPDASLLAELQRERALSHAAARIGAELDTYALAAALAEAAVSVLEADAAAVISAGALAAQQALPETLADALRTGVPDAVARCSRERRVLAASDVASDDRFGAAWQETLQTAGMRALLAVPVEAPQAALVLALYHAPRAFADEDIAFAQRLAEAAAGAFARAAAFEEERTARTLAQLLANTASRLGTEVDPIRLLEEAVERARMLVAADASAVRLVDGDELTLQLGSGEGIEPLVGNRVATTSLFSGDVHQSRSPIPVVDAAADERYRDADPILEMYASYLGVPLVVPEGAVHGVLSVYARAPREWREDEVRALAALAENAAAALANAERFTSVAEDRERSYAILANIADGIVAVDRDGDVVLWNAAAERITGVPGTEAVGRAPAQVLGRELEVGEAEPGRLVPITRGSEEVWLSVTEAVMRDPTGAVAGRIFAFRDISSDRFVEEMKSEFVSTVSHELRGPLTSIYGFAETLLREDVVFDENERSTFLRYIAEESLRLTSIVDTLLNVARLDAGDLQVNLQPTDVRVVASEVVAGVERGGRNGLAFVLDLPEQPLDAIADRDKLRQVLEVLVDNAVKFSRDRGTVTIAASRTPSGVELRIADEGAGIPQAEQERIFRKFYRGGAVATGTGVGLFIAEKLVAAMGGRISVESEEGRGSLFSFELPAAVVVESEQPRV